MYHAVGMRGMYRPRQSLKQLCRWTHGLGHTVEVLGQAAPRDKLQSKIGLTRYLSDLIDLHDVGML